MKARDSKRLSDLQQINNAINMYFSNYGNYPICSNAYINDINDCLTLALKAAGVMSSVPANNISGNSSSLYQYYTDTNGTIYALRGALEGRPLQKTYNYPDGVLCITPGLPTCGWYNSCVYEGYGSNCAQTKAYGSN